MPKYSCDYCSVYLSHDSAAGRKQHYRGKKHHENVKAYYEKLIAAGETGGVNPVSEGGAAIPTTLGGSKLPITGLLVIHPYVQPCMLYYRLPQWHAGMIARPPRAVPPGYQQVMQIATQLAQKQQQQVASVRRELAAARPIPVAVPTQQFSSPPPQQPYGAPQPHQAANQAPASAPYGQYAAPAAHHPHPYAPATHPQQPQPPAAMHPARMRALGMG